jgi:parvulin-like peptidyl-prolyl isomerase
MTPKTNRSISNTSIQMALVLASFLPCSLLGISNAKAETELAKVNGTSISLESFTKKYNQLVAMDPINPPSKTQFLDQMIRHQLTIQTAKNLGIEKDLEVQERIDSVLSSALIEKNLGADFQKVFVTDEQAKAYYEKNPEIRISIISVNCPSNAAAAEQKKAAEKMKKIYDDQKLSDGKTVFSDIAQKFSEDPYAPMGGDMDYQGRDRLDPAVYDSALALKEPGKVSSVVRSPFGYHAIKLTGIRKWDDANKITAKQAAIREAQGKILSQYLDSLRSKAKVSIRSELLK